VGGRKEGRLKKKETENKVNTERKTDRKKERKGFEQIYRKKSTKYCNIVTKLMNFVYVCVFV
jgi:hypothetical protein